MLAAAVGQDNAAIARELGVCTDTVRKWRSRFAVGLLRRIDAHHKTPSHAVAA